MSEIEKMYENAGLDKLWVERYNDGNGFEHENWYPSYKVMIKSMMEKYGWTLMEAQNVAKKECQKELLPFTAEKQLELIKWLAIKDYGKYTTSLLININSSYVRFSAGLQAGVHCLDVKYDKQSINFENSLAGLVNNLWQDLTEEEKQEIRGVLNG